MSDCDALERKLAAIERKISQLQSCCNSQPNNDQLKQQITAAVLATVAGSYVAKSDYASGWNELKNNVNSALDKAKENELAQKALNTKVNEAKEQARKAFYNSEEFGKLASEALRTGNDAKLNAALAKAEADAARRAVKESNRKAVSNSRKVERVASRASKAERTANAARNTANEAKRIANRALSLVKALAQKVNKLAGDIAKALAKALEAIGISKAAQKAAMRALSRLAQLASKVFWIFDIVMGLTSLANMIDLRGRMSRLEGRMSALERDLDILFRAINAVNSKVSNLAQQLPGIRSIAEQAQSLASSARGIATSARATANEARNQAIANAAAIAVNVAAIGAASALAGRALNAAKTSSAASGAGRTVYIDNSRVINRTFYRTTQVNRVVDRTRVVAPVINRTTVVNKPVNTSAFATRPYVVSQVRSSGMNPADRALLQRINATTTATRAAQNGHVALTTSVQQATKAMGDTLKTVSQFSKKTWDFLQIDRILAVITWVGVMHNAYFLSRNIADTLFYMVGQGLNLIGVEDSEGGPIDVNGKISEFMNSAAAAMIGEENLEGIKAEWAMHSRIYQASMNLLNSIRYMTDSIHMALEGVGQYVASIGNALKRSGTILENSFGYMNRNIANVRNKVQGRWEKAFQTIETTDSIVSSAAAITGDVVNIADSTAMVAQARADFAAAVAAEAAENQILEVEAKLNSEAPVSLEEANPYTVGERE